MAIIAAVLAVTWVLQGPTGWTLDGLEGRACAAPAMTDQAISDKVEDELQADPGVNSARVDVTTQEGIVQLNGRVGSILAKERAARIAETVKGVRAVVNQIDVNPSVLRTEDDIANDVSRALREDPATDAYELTIAVEDGVVAVTGTVDSYQERELVKKVVKDVRGVVGVRDQLTVEYADDRPDREIKQDILQTFRWNVHVDHALINVSVDGGDVVLSGTVGSAAEKRLAKRLAWVAGVRSVDDAKLQVERWARDEQLRGDKYVLRSGEELRRAIEAALEYDPRVDASAVDIRVAGSTVTLRGVVDNLKAKRAAERDARHTVGVTSVANRLKVRLDAPPEDQRIAGQIRSALLRNPYIERFEIKVTVRNGTARLYGTVDSMFEKDLADDVASRVRGVVLVENHIEVSSKKPYFFDAYVDDDYVREKELIGYERRAPLRTDNQIRESIESQLWWSPFVNADQVTVVVDDGIATLTGTVDSAAERRSATENAYEGGATLVDNELKVDLE